MGLFVLEDDGSLVQLLDDTLLIVAYPWGAREYNGFIYFVALSTGNPLQLWRSDGTRDGTRFVGDLSDGTEAGTRLHADLRRGPEPSRRRPRSGAVGDRPR